MLNVCLKNNEFRISVLCMAQNFFLVLITGRFFFFFLFMLHLQHREVPGPGVESKLQLGPVPQPWQHWIQAASVIIATACSNARSLTQWVRPGIEPSSSQRQHYVFNLLNHRRNSIEGFKMLTCDLKKLEYSLQLKIWKLVEFPGSLAS